MASNNKKNSPKASNQNNTEPEENIQQHSAGSDDLSEVNRNGEYDNLNEEDVIKSAGAKPHIVGDKSQLNRPAPQAIHPGQTFDLNEQQQQFSQEQPGENNPHIDNGPAPSEGNNFNSGFEEVEPNIDEELPTDDHLATANYIHQLAKKGVHQLPKLFSISQKKIEKLHEKKELDATVVVPKSAMDPRPVTIFEVVRDFNEDIKRPFDIPDEWIEENNPLLARILAKKGAALSPEAQYGLNCGMLFIGITMTSVDVLRSRNSFLDALKEYTTTMSARNNQPANAGNPPASTENTSQPAAAPEAEIPKGKEAEKVIKAIVKKNVDKKKTVKAKTSSAAVKA